MAKHKENKVHALFIQEKMKIINAIRINHTHAHTHCYVCVSRVR